MSWSTESSVRQNHNMENGIRNAEVQQELLRRFVDEWGVRGSHILKKSVILCTMCRFFPLIWKAKVGLLQEPYGCTSTFGLKECFQDDHIKLIYLPHEFCSIPSLVETENIPFNKLMIVLSYNCCEISAITEKVVCVPSAVFPASFHICIVFFSICFCSSWVVLNP